MNKFLKSIRPVEWLAFIVMPAMFFPVFWSVATLHDWLAGDKKVLTSILYGSRGRLLDEFMGDWLASLPFSMLASWVIFFPIYLFAGRAVQGSIATPVFAGAAGGLVLGIWLYRLETIGVMIMAVTGCLIGIGMLLMKALFNR